MKFDNYENPFSDTRIGEFFLWAMFAVSILHAAFYLSAGLFQPLMDLHSFRQTQTAISAYWALHDGFKIAYETPVLGYPWSIPFEFPIFQWLVATLAYCGIPLDIAGRILSFTFFAGCIFPLWILFKSFRFGRHILPMSGVLLFSAPLYIYWSRAFMIESCALFFGLLWLAMLVRLSQNRSVVYLLATAGAGTMSVLVKSTTFLGFGFVGGLWILSHLIALYRQRNYQELKWAALCLATACLVPLVIGYGWVVYSDNVKQLSPFGGLLTSQALTAWNFGTWAQRTSLHLWQGVILGRAMNDDFGYSALIAFLACGWALTKRFAPFIIVAILGFLVPFVVFTNLQMVHEYYQNANAIFILVAVSLALASIAETGRPTVAIALLVTIALGQCLYFHKTYAKLIDRDFTNDNIYQIALEAKKIVPSDQVILVFGVDWSSAVNYYAERKGIALMEWAPQSLTKALLEDPGAFMGGKLLGGIVYCVGTPYRESQALVSAYVGGRRELSSAGRCLLLSADR